MRYVITGILLLVLVSCTVTDSESVYSKPVFEEFLELNCEARRLKDERFTLAERLRKDEDYVSNPDSLKEALASQSRELAERIRVKLDALTGEMKLEEKRIFNDSLEARIAKMGCE